MRRDKVVNQKTITQINGLKLTWIKGCNYTEQIKNDSSDSPNENSQETQNITGEENKSGQMPVNVDNQSAQCKLIKGTGHKIIVRPELLDWGNWIYDTLYNTSPYNEFNWSLYTEKNEGDCTGNYSDTRFVIEPINSKGLSWFDGSSINKVWFNSNLEQRGYNFKWNFLLFHELGHIFLKNGHTNNGGIMDLDGGNAEYNEEQINIIRSNLK